LLVESVSLYFLHKLVTDKYMRCISMGANSRDRSDTVEDERRSVDSDVLAEAQAVGRMLLRESDSDGEATAGVDLTPPLLCRDLQLTYKPFVLRKCLNSQVKTAVRKLTFKVADSHIFGLLGPNGAGKTSTMRILTGLERKDFGSVFVDGVSVEQLQPADLFDKVSVCSQDNALWPSMTVHDHLYYYAWLRGFRGDSRGQLVSRMIDWLQIGKHANKPCSQLSGGTKRKVCFAIAMLKTSRVRLILCDEPTSGLDPQSKRLIWHMLSTLVRTDPTCACVFTSHSMEEVEAVCDRIGILINGQLHCLGSIQHCKNKFGGQYIIELKLKRAEGLEGLLAFLKKRFPNAEQLESLVQLIVRVNLPRSDVQSLGLVFQLLEEARRVESFEIEDYSFGQCSLEQVFIGLVKKHANEVLPERTTTL
jgi:ATP-binding cassette subfamily A (ABC1) protein 5